MPPCWTDRACCLRKASVKLRKPGSQLSTRRWSSGRRRNCRSFSWPTATGAICSASPGILRPSAATRRSWPNCLRVRPRPGPAISASTRAGLRRARPWSAGATSWRRSSPSRPSTARAMARSGCCAKPTARCAPGRFRPRSISMPSAPRARLPPRHPTSGILPAPTGSSSGRPPRPMTAAIPTC